MTDPKLNCTAVLPTIIDVSRRIGQFDFATMLFWVEIVHFILDECDDLMILLQRSNPLITLHDYSILWLNSVDKYTCRRIRDTTVLPMMMTWCSCCNSATVTLSWLPTVHLNDTMFLLLDKMVESTRTSKPRYSRVLIVSMTWIISAIEIEFAMTSNKGGEIRNESAATKRENRIKHRSHVKEGKEVESIYLA